MGHVHHTFHPVQRDLWRCAHTRESQVEIQMLCKQFTPPKEKRQFYQKSVNTILFLEEISPLTEARSKMNAQELRVESANKALRESSLQIQSQRMELYQANRSFDCSRRERWALHRIRDGRISGRS